MTTHLSEPLHDEDCNSRHYLGTCDCSQRMNEQSHGPGCVLCAAGQPATDHALGDS